MTAITLSCPAFTCSDTSEALPSMMLASLRSSAVILDPVSSKDRNFDLAPRLSCSTNLVSASLAVLEPPACTSESGVFFAAATKSENELNCDFALVTTTWGSVATSVMGVRSARVTLALATVIGVANQVGGTWAITPVLPFLSTMYDIAPIESPAGMLRTGQLVSMILFSYITLII